MDTLKVLHDTVFLVAPKIGLDSINVLVNSAKSDHTPLLLILSPIIALMAVIIGPAVQLYISKKQVEHQNALMVRTFEAQSKMKEDEIKKTFISEKRVLWIENLRGLFSEYSGKIWRQVALTSHKNAGPEAHIDLFEEIMRLAAQIELNLNPEEDDHKAMVSLVKKIRVVFRKNKLIPLSLNPILETSSQLRSPYSGRNGKKPKN